MITVLPMSVLIAPAPASVVLHFGQDLLDRLFPAAPGTIARLDTGANLLFAGCGDGETLATIARLFPRSRFVGTEPGTGALDAACASIRARGLQNTRVSPPDSVRQPHLQGIFDFIIRLDGEASAPLDALPALLRKSGLLFDLGQALPSAADYHDMGLIILRSLALPDGCTCIIAGNWLLPAPRT